MNSRNETLVTLTYCPQVDGLDPVPGLQILELQFRSAYAERFKQSVSATGDELAVSSIMTSTLTFSLRLG